jgi:hypothetical protein
MFDLTFGPVLSGVVVIYFLELSYC